MTKTEVAEAKSSQVSADVYDYGADAGAGMDDVTMDQLSIPFINIAQSNSDVVANDLIDGIKAGLIYNNVTNEILNQPLIVVPVHREEQWVEWVPRLKGGGLVGRHDPDSDLVKSVIETNGGSRIPPKDAQGKRNPFSTPDGNDLIETYYVYCLLLDAEGETVESHAVLSFSGTKIGVYRKWLTSMFTIKGKPPLFANRAQVSTVKQQSDAGPYYNFAIGPVGKTWRDGLIHPVEQKALLEEGKSFASMIMEGKAVAGNEEAAPGNADPSSGSNRSQKEVGDEDMPF